MNLFGKFFIRGVTALVPIGATLAALYWLAVLAESALGELIRPLMPQAWQWPGMGLLAGLVAAVVLVFLAGVLVSVGPGRWLLQAGESLLGRIPLVKTFLQTMHDFTQFIVAPREHRDFGQVVWVPFGDMRLIGFVTRGPAYGPASTPGGDRAVPVYLPFSYQIGGYTIYVPRSRLEPAGLSVEEAMRVVITAGVSMSEMPRPVSAPAPPAAGP